MDDTPAVQAVLKADVKRLRLLEEEKKLLSASEKGDDSQSDRLQEVRDVLQNMIFFVGCVCEEGREGEGEREEGREGGREGGRERCVCM